MLTHVGGDLPRPVEHVAKDEHDSLPRRKHVDGREKRDLDRLTRHEPFIHWKPPIGIRLKPRKFRGGSHRLGAVDDWRPQVPWHDPGRSPLERIEAGVRRDAIEPRTDCLRSQVALSLPPCLEEGLLDEIVGIVQRSEHTVAVEVELPPMPLEQRTEINGRLTTHLTIGSRGQRRSQAAESWQPHRLAA